MKKKIIFSMLMAFIVIIANAQTAVQSSKIFDNVYVSIEGGASTPLTFDKVFPLNGTATLRVGKQFTPVWGAEVEGTAWFGSHSDYDGITKRFDGSSHNAFRGSYVGVNGTTNITNLFGGYKGAPRVFEVSTVLGAGWIHTFTPSTADKYNNYFGVKTGLELAFNIGKAKAHTINVRPAVLWNVTQPGNDTNGLAFNKRGAQIYLGIGYTYHFKTSNGTHYFKTHDIGEYEATIVRLNDELAKKPKEVIVEKIVTRDAPATNATVIGTTIINFAQNSYALDSNATAELDKVNGTVKVAAYASPEGTEAYNKTLSQRRADAVAEYLRGRGITVTEAIGYGVTGDASNRIAIITAE